ncbi:GDNF family receptor alpha-1 isoform X1 [Perognathus longimembris pacificus]|uniref:GDNF family receptor alpha-1 isoform X1 n=1 Tax=Perognathus longimembris pacificus TaxID=214514 RepID=UPI0020197CA7|nr:GDNF family receptor alpha-1 isoform X1 [Perognathus longimembris pacificus]XP_048194135.1 GDNF family receptor alpha-1 isoform X1 [Perognathus longimembris pacificus]XP_048194136.1 GDNF family receptor alpha-1 isoform X1 [Perognathus longimembris pacificus]
MFLASLYFALPLLDLLLSAEVSGGDRLDCVKASDQCLKEQSCSTKYRTLRQCVAGKETNFSLASGLEAKDECRSAMEALKQKSLYNCRCKRGMKKEKNCLRIYWSMYQSLQGNDLLEDSPYEPVNSRLSDIFRVVPFISDVFQQVEHIPKGNNCLDAAKACNLDDTCKKYRSAYITPCTSSMSNEICNRRKCHKALRQFFDKVPAKHSYGMLFCSCRDIACTERRRQTIVPVCSYEEREKPNCLNLQESCKTNYICRSRLADFFTNCQPESRSVSSCLKENYADCLLAYSGLIGTVMTPNYIDSSSLSVAPWCDCSNSGNELEECLKFLNFFKDNTCLKNAIQAFGNGSDVTVWRPAFPVQTTTATTTTAFRGKNKPQAPAGSENEIPTHVLPPCANLQAQKLKSNVSGSTHLCLSDRDYEKDGLAGASSHITTKSMAAPSSCGLNPLLVLVVTALSTLLSLSLAETS